MIMKGTVFWDVTACSLVHMLYHLWKTCCNHLSSRQKIKPRDRTSKNVR